VLAGRDEGPEGAALVAVHEVHGVLSSVELEDRRQELLAEALLLQPLGDRVGGRHLVLEIRVLDHHPAVAEGIVAAEELRAGLRRECTRRSWPDPLSDSCPPVQSKTVLSMSSAYFPSAASRSSRGG